MIDKIHSATTFIKYQSEQSIDMNDPRIIPELRNHPFVNDKILEGKDLADIFFITEEECVKYNITKEDVEQIVNTIRSFASEIYKQKLEGILLDVKSDFPNVAMKYNKRI